MASGPAWKKRGSFRRERGRTTSIPQQAPRIDHSVPLMVVTSPEFPIRRTKNAGGEREFPQHGNVTAKFAHNIPMRALQPKLNRGRQGWRPRISWIIDDVVCAERSSRNCSWDDGIRMSQPAVLVLIGQPPGLRPKAFERIGPVRPGRSWEVFHLDKKSE